MKRILSLMLACLMAIGMIPAMALITSAEETRVTAKEAEPVQAAFPASFSLVGSSCLPPIDNQGGVGSCVSQTSTYMQFTNAVAHYMQNLGYSSWKPNNNTQYGDDNYIFSPKFTYNFAGAATLPVADVLMTMGCLPQTLSKFYKSGSASAYKVSGIWKTKTVSWDVGEGLLEQALHYRLGGYRHYWATNVAGGQITTTTEGRKLISDIKTALLDGNVVLTGGVAGQWSYGNMTRAGKIAKAGETLVYAALENGGGGHQVSIVGYDDDCEYVIGGVTLKGAFLVANSWGQDWGNKGYFWFMYDGINLVSEYAGQTSALSAPNRNVALDQYMITDWRNDIIVGDPTLAVTAEVATTDRRRVDVELIRFDPLTEELTGFMPYMFQYDGIQDSYDLPSDRYFNYDGFVDGNEATAYFTFSYDKLLENLPAGKTYEDYVWGVRVIAEDGYTGKLKKVTLKDSSLQVLYTADVNHSVSGDSFVYLCDEDCYVLCETPHVTVVPVNGSTIPAVKGSDFSFTLLPDDGFTDELAEVCVNGTRIRPVNGVYTVSDVRELLNITVDGIIENVSSKPMSVGVYNWEIYDGHPVLNITVDTSVLKRDVYAAGIGKSSYPYRFRLTDQATGISYYITPHSIYDFGYNILYRLPLDQCGIRVIDGTRYELTVDVTYGGRTLYTGSIVSTATTSSTAPSGLHYVNYSVNGDPFAKDAFPKGAAIIVRDVPMKNGEKGTWVGDTIPATMGNGDISVRASYGSILHTVRVNGNVCTVAPATGSSLSIADGGGVSFTLQAPAGFTADLATVTWDGARLTPENGIYTITDVREDIVLDVTGIIEDVKDKFFSPSMYNNAGWEYYGDEYVMVVSVNNSDLDPDIYALNSDLGSYPYYFRLTDQATGVSYYMQPSSFYHFSSSTLYRLPTQPAGFSAVAGRTYSFTVDMVYRGRTLYTGSMTTPCGYGSNVAPTGSVRTVSYSVKGSTVAKDAFVVGAPTVIREAPAGGEHTTVTWSGDTVPAVMNDRDYTLSAAYAEETYLVSWVVDNKVTTESYTYGSTPSFKGDLSKPNAGAVGYRFIGWDKTLSPVTANVTYTAQYEETTAVYTVTWVVAAGSFTEEYEYGALPSFKGDTSKPSTTVSRYLFTGWNKSLRAVTKDVTYTAVYEEYSLSDYSVKWNVNGTVTEEIYPAGSTPTYKGATPTKPNTAQYTYVFCGWTNGSMAYDNGTELPKVTGNVTYTAIFDGTLNSYTVTWIVDGRTTTSTVNYGTVPTFVGRTEKPDDDSFSYTFNGWSPALKAVTGDVTYTAVYKKTAKSGIVGDINGDGIISIMDVTELLSAIATGKSGSVYDVSGDSIISIIDVTTLLTLLANL